MGHGVVLQTAPLLLFAYVLLQKATQCTLSHQTGAAAGVLLNCSQNTLAAAQVCCCISMTCEQRSLQDSPLLLLLLTSCTD
jgi:hypothetical protein